MFEFTFYVALLLILNEVLDFKLKLITRAYIISQNSLNNLRKINIS